jgi:hypothetical protein
MFEFITETFSAFTASEPSQKPLAEYAKVIDDVLKEFGLDECRADLSDGFGWTLQRGSAVIFIGLSKNSVIEEETIKIFSPILKLPKQNLLPFYRRCLELNDCLVGCALAADDNGVLIVTERPVLGLDKAEIIHMILNVGMASDGLDNRLAEEFGAEMVGEE